MKRNGTLEDQIIKELSELLNAESQLARALPKLAQASQSPALKKVLENQQGVTNAQVNCLQDIVSERQRNPERTTGGPVQDIIKEGQEYVDNAPDPGRRDTAILDVAQRVKRYEIQGYSKACEHATRLGDTQMANLLYKNLNEERAMNLDLSELAQTMINIQAIENTHEDR